MLFVYSIYRTNPQIMVWRNDDKLCDNLLLHSAGLTHQKSFAEVAIRLLTDSLGKLRWEEQTLLFTNCCQNTTDLEQQQKHRDYGRRKEKISWSQPENFKHSNQSKPHHLHLTSSVLGRGTLIARQRLRIGPMTLEVEVEQRMRRQVPMYFSIVRRKACWASFVSLSTSVSNTTENKSEHITITARA